ncbi:MAG: DUF389 domain-containing protein [Desulfuromonadales bacterium]|nr:DUF389 domain-containing protein [Desulfuromonadales bacterium]
MTPGAPENYPLREALHRLRQTVNKYFDSKSVDVQHKEVIKELYSRTDMTGTYIASLVFANLIALLGLLSNSVAVVIGAMLISPLMGPIFTLGLAFALGHLTMARKAARIITISVLVTVLAAAIFTLLSPLKEVTPEILARTRPNIYDLFIAIFCGAIGAIALCTRKSYLFTTTGVAIATAVIPPLSVVGYGIGTFQFSMAAGGFFLFFTNLVAIVISSDIVFMLLRFRTSMVEESPYPLRLRLRVLGVTLALISVPLITILVIDIRALKFTKRIEQTLKGQLNLNGQSRLTSFSINRDDPVIKVLATVNTVTEFDATTEKVIQNALASQSNRPIELQLEQVVVKAGTIKPQTTPLLPGPSALIPSASAPSVPENLATLRIKTMTIIRAGCDEAGTFLAPWPVRSCEVSFSAESAPATLHLRLGRDFPLREQEERWLNLAVAKKLQEEVVLKLSTVPLLPPLTVGDDGIPDAAGVKALALLKELLRQEIPLRLTLHYPTGGRNNLKRARLLQVYLEKELGIAGERITLKSSGSSFLVTVAEGR